MTTAAHPDPLGRIASILGRVAPAEMGRGAEILESLGASRDSELVRQAARAIEEVRAILAEPEPPDDRILCRFGPEGGRVLGGDGPNFTLISDRHPYALDAVLWQRPEGVTGPLVWQGRLTPVHFDRTFRGLKFEGSWRPPTESEAIRWQGRPDSGIFEPDDR